MLDIFPMQANPREWTPIPGYPDYEIRINPDAPYGGEIRSWLKQGGSVKRRETPLLLKGNPGHKEHLRFGLCRNGVEETQQLGVWLLRTFVGPAPADDSICCHWDDDPTNNCLSNLRWGTHKANYADRKRHGTDNSGERNGLAKADENLVAWIRSSNLSSSKIADQLGFNQATVYRIRTGILWPELNDKYPPQKNYGSCRYPDWRPA